MREVTRRHQNAQRLLRPLAVVNPYAPKLTFPANSLRARRDHKKYLGVIKVMAFLHQYQREIKSLDGEPYIEVTLPDIERANRLCGEVLGQTLDELSAPGRALLAKVRAMVKEKAREAGGAPDRDPVYPEGYPGFFGVERLPGEDPYRGVGGFGIPLLGDGQEGQGVRVRVGGRRGRGGWKALLGRADGRGETRGK